MNIAILNQNALIQREVIAALRRLPHVSVLVIDIQTHPVVEQVEKVQQALLQHTCTVLCTINEWGIDNSGVLSAFCSERGIFHVNWTVDDPFYEEIIHTKKFRPSSLRIDFISDKGYLTQMEKRGYTARYLPLAVDTELFTMPDNDTRSSGFDIVFVGNSYFRQIDRFLQLVPGFIDTLSPFIGEVVNSYLADVRYDVEHAIAQHLQEVTLPSEVSFEKACFIAKHTAGYFGRKRMIQSLVNRFEGFRLFGDRGWAQDIPEERIGTAKYYDSLRTVYQRAKITIDINRMVIRNGFTQRVFDAPACGSLLITSSKPVVYETFVTSGPEKEAVVFTSLEDLHTKIEYYLTHAEERIATAHRGYEKIVGKHTYDRRIATILSTVEERIASIQ